MSKNVTCPQCGQADQVEKVSAIYINAIEREKRKKKEPAPPGSDAETRKKTRLARIMDPRGEPLARRLAPPASGKQVQTRPIHPDLPVISFSLVAPIFLIGIYTSQPAMLLPVILILACAYALYFWQRKAIVAKFEQQQTARRAAEERVKKGIERWMKLYYCARDDGVFEASSRELTPTDQMPGLLLKD